MRDHPSTRVLVVVSVLLASGMMAACFSTTDDSGRDPGNDGGVADAAGSPDGGSLGDGGGGTTDGGGGMTDGGGGMTDGGGGMTDGGGPPAGACENRADQGVLATADLAAAGSTCGINCISAPDRVACLTPCIETETASSGAQGLSTPCAACVAELTDCTLANCLSVCVVDPNAPECVTCRCDLCEPVFAACAGFGSGQCGA